MAGPARLQSRTVIWLFILILPPVGLLLLWMKRDSRLLAKLAGSLAVIASVILHLYFFWGLRVELDAGFTRPIISFKNAEKRSKEIERRHEEEHSVDASRMQIPAPPPAATPPVAVSLATKPPEETQSESRSTYWTDFRGPGRSGIYDEGEILTDWPSGRLPLLWKRPVGGGYASVVVANGTIFTIEQRRQKEFVAAYDLGSGREKWIHGWDAEFRETLGGDGPRATPVWHEGRIYALGAAGELRCLDARSGSRIWSRNILSDSGAANLRWGMAASPLIVDDKVIVLPGASQGRSVAAYNRLTGEPMWKALDDQQAYVSPQLATLAGRRQILVVSAKHVMGLAVEDGLLLWKYPWDTYDGINAAQPIITAENRFFISSGYDHGAALVEISAQGEAFEARTVWQSNRMKNTFSSSVLYKGFIYGLDEAILACMDAATGELRWKGGRYGHGQVLLASGHLIMSSETGDVALVKASSEKHEEIARFSAIEGKTWNVPAIADGRLIVRNAAEMACFLIGKQAHVARQ
jgi:outer membrane protein assembly factor BamB